MELYKLLPPNIKFHSQVQIQFLLALLQTRNPNLILSLDGYPLKQYRFKVLLNKAQE